MAKLKIWVASKELECSSMTVEDSDRRPVSRIMATIPMGLDQANDIRQTWRQVQKFEWQNEMGSVYKAQGIIDKWRLSIPPQSSEFQSVSLPECLVEAVIIVERPVYSRHEPSERVVVAPALVTPDPDQPKRKLML